MNALPTHPFLCFFLAHFLIGLFAGAGFAGTVNKHETVATINRKCLDCHGNIERVGSKFLIDPERYGRSEHARLGCSVCHAAVAEKHPNIVGTSPKPDCSGCHRKTGAEYMASSHASKASCGDCHDPHRVNAPSEISSRDMNKMCAGCHERYRIITIHARWLPQTERHIEMLPCITCHTGSENYLVSIY